MAKMSGSLLSRQKGQILLTPLQPSNQNLNQHCLTKQDSMPRRPRRGSSPERNPTKQAVVQKSGGSRSRGVRESVSDLSISLDGFDSFSSFFSTDGSGPNQNSSGQSSSSFNSLSPPLRRKFSTSSRLSLFSSQPPEKKKNRRSGKKLPAKVDRWDSWEDCAPKGSPQKPQRKDLARVSEKKAQCVVNDSTRTLRPMNERKQSSFDDGEISRWSSHSVSSHVATASPRKIGSPRKPSRQPPTVTPLPSPPLQATRKQELKREQEIVFNPQQSTHRSLNQYLQAEEKINYVSTRTVEHRAALSRQPKAYNLLVQESSQNHHPATTPATRLPPWNLHSTTDADTIRKLKCSLDWAESKRSVATSSTRDSAASSAAYPDYSIPWFAHPPHQKSGK